MYFLRFAALVTAILIFSTSNSLGQSAIDSLRDKPIFVTKKQFDSIVIRSTTLLKTKKLNEISDSGHTDIIRVYNTILFKWIMNDKKLSGIYYDFFYWADHETGYTHNITKVRDDWTLSRGLGYYFKKLNVELTGTPFLRSMFEITDENHP
jgi:hypothetical protein